MDCGGGGGRSPAPAAGRIFQTLGEPALPFRGKSRPLAGRANRRGLPVRLPGGERGAARPLRLGPGGLVGVVVGRPRTLRARRPASPSSPAPRARRCSRGAGRGRASHLLSAAPAPPAMPRAALLQATARFELGVGPLSPARPGGATTARRAAMVRCGARVAFPARGGGGRVPRSLLSKGWLFRLRRLCFFSARISPRKAGLSLPAAILQWGVGGAPEDPPGLLDLGLFFLFYNFIREAETATPVQFS